MSQSASNPPTFADPKTDFVFKRIFGSEPHKHLLIQLLNTLLELDEGRLITEIAYLPPEQTTEIPEMKLSIVDVKCVDQRGTKYVVEMQLLNVEGFEERIVYNASKAFTIQLRRAEGYPKLKDVVGVTICDFCLWDEPGEDDEAAVPMLSRWRMQEQHSSRPGLPQVQYVFLELPKYQGGEHPETFIDKWALFFRDAENLEVIPPELDEGPYKEAFEVARMARFTEGELEAYRLNKMAEQDARGALVKAKQEGRREGRQEGRAETLRATIEDFCLALGIDWSAQRKAESSTLDLSQLQALWARLLRDRSWPRTL